MEFKDLVGTHKLSGVDTSVEAIKLYEWSEDTEECDVVSFVLDGVTYKAIEDPSDGYRSYYRELIVSNDKLSNMFPPQEVVGVMMSTERYETNDVIQFIDTVTNKVVLEVGTSNTDDYYPCCVLHWSPENLTINCIK